MPSSFSTRAGSLEAVIQRVVSPVIFASFPRKCEKSQPKHAAVLLFGTNHHRVLAMKLLVAAAGPFGVCEADNSFDRGREREVVAFGASASGSVAASGLGTGYFPGQTHKIEKKK
jgi:hypothetical protein